MQRKANKQLHVVQVFFFFKVHNTTQGQRTCTQDQVCKAHALSSTSHRGETGVKSKLAPLIVMPQRGQLDPTAAGTGCYHISSKEEIAGVTAPRPGHGAPL